MVLSRCARRARQEWQGALRDRAQARGHTVTRRSAGRHQRLRAMLGTHMDAHLTMTVTTSTNLSHKKGMVGGLGSRRCDRARRGPRPRHAVVWAARNGELVVAFKDVSAVADGLYPALSVVRVSPSDSTSGPRPSASRHPTRLSLRSRPSLRSRRVLPLSAILCCSGAPPRRHH